jgi:phosphoglycerate dehydrogenase-like enzyme
MACVVAQIRSLRSKLSNLNWFGSIQFHSIVFMKILLSELALRGLSKDIATVMGSRPFECVSFEDAVASGRRDFDVAFVSRDVTGLSTKHELAPSLKACYKVLEESPNLRWVHIHSAGADRDVYVRLRAKGVQVATSSGANAEVVAQTALAGLLALSRKFPELVHAMHAKKWAPLLGSQLPPDLSGQTALLVGWGPIAQRVAQFLTMLGLRLKVVRQQVQTESPEKSASHSSQPEMLTFETIESALPSADWVILMCPLTETTRGLINARRLSLLPKGAGLVNVARGEVVVEKDLIEALENGSLGSAYLDVFEHEPLSQKSPLWSLPNVIVTPHSAGFSAGNEKRVSQMFLANLDRWASV